jgi:hypothetical protein
MRRYLGLVLLALSCSRDPPRPTSAPASPANLGPPVDDCTRVLDNAAHTTVRISRHDPPSYEPSDEVKAVRAKSGLTELGGDIADAHRPDARRITPAPSGRSRCDALERAPVIVITKDELRVGDIHVASIAEATARGDVIDALARALPAAEDAGMAILLADDSTDVVVINRVIITCRQAGYSNLLFAATRSPASAGHEIEVTREMRL